MKARWPLGTETTICSTAFHYVEFQSYGLPPKVRKGEVVVFQDESQGKPKIRFSPGVTGYEQYYLEDLAKTYGQYTHQGIWPCVGTKARWNAMYIHGWEFQRIWESLELDDILSNHQPSNPSGCEEEE
jgi:hypothetical protein